MEPPRLEDRHCPLCGPDAPKRVKFPASFSIEDLNESVFSARRLPDRRHFRLMECRQCGMIFSDPACDADALRHLYTQGRVTYERVESHIYDSYAPLLLRALPRVRARHCFVEIGGGSGFLLRFGREQGFARLVEVEPSADAERMFPSHGSGGEFIRDMFHGGVLPPGSVSLACFFQMLDHVPHPLPFLRDVLAALEPGGVAVCAVHNTRAWSARLLGERSPIFDIEHTALFNPRNIAALFTKAGFAAPEVFGFSNRYTMRYWLHLAPLPRAAKERLLLPAIEKTGIADWRIPLPAGNLCIIAAKPAQD